METNTSRQTSLPNAGISSMRLKFYIITGKKARKTTVSPHCLHLAASKNIAAVSTDLLEKTHQNNYNKVCALVLDFSQLQYISSAGLRVLSATQKTMNTQGSMVIRGINETIMEVFEVTGFCDILTLE